MANIDQSIPYSQISEQGRLYYHKDMVIPNQEYYKRLFDDAPIGIYRTTPGGEILDGNQALCSLLGYSDLAALQAVNFNQLFTQPEERQNTIKSMLETGEIEINEYQLRHLDGKLIGVRETTRAIYSEDGEITYIEGILEEISAKDKSTLEFRETQTQVESEPSQRQLAETLREISHTIIAKLDLNEVLEHVLTSLADIVPYDRATLRLLEDKSLYVAAEKTINQEGQTQELVALMEQKNLIQKILTTAQPLVFSDPQSYTWLENYAQARVVHSWIGVPLVSRGEVIGLLTLESQNSDCYGEYETQVTFSFTSQVATAIDNARLFEKLQKRANELSALRDTSADITAELDLSTLLQAILERAIKLINASGGELGLYNASTETITIAACHNMPKDDTGTTIQSGQGALGIVVQTGKPLLLGDYKTWNGRLSSFIDWPYRDVIAVPLLVKERVLGVIALTDAREDHQFTEKNMQLLTLFAQQAAIAIDNAQLFDQTQFVLADTQKLYRAARSLISTQSIDDLLQDLLDNVSEALPADRVVLYVIDIKNQEVTRFAKGGPRSEDLQPASFEELWDGFTGWAVRKRQPVLSPKDSDDPRESAHVRKLRRESDSGSLVVVPLLYREEVLGTITAINRKDERDFTHRDAELLGTIANHASIAIKNSQLFDIVQHLAETDELTEIHNRRQLFVLGEREYLRSRRYKVPLSVIMLDIDNFKEINDTHGHAVGDGVLRTLATICQKNIRNVDILGRYGGEEFVIILPETGMKKATAVAERIREFIAESPFPTKNGEIPVTISLGVAEMKASTADLAALIDRADTAMYKAKNSGKNQVEVV
jgi:diguanylate cyclase (GGDEF)-like protein/PAS domain S-box-containing protein